MKLEQQTGNRPAIIRLVSIQFLALLVVGLFTLLILIYRRHDSLNDLHLYYKSSLSLFRGQVPYRDFPLEYPPLSLLPMVLPQLVTLGQPLSFRSYLSIFLLENALLSTLVMLILVQILRYLQLRQRTMWVLKIYVVFVAISAPILAWRFDLFPALLTQLALLSVLVGRPTLAGIWLGFGITAKLYPIVLIPIFSIYYLAGRKYNALLRLLLASIGATGLILLPFFLLARGTLFSFLRYHQVRGLQVETIPAGVISLAHMLGLTQARIDFNYGAFHLVSPLADSVLKLQPFVFILAFLVISVTCLSRFQDEQANSGAITIESLVAYVFVALLTFMVTSKVFSPQYIIWLLPFAPLLPRRQTILMIAIFTLSILLYPWGYRLLLNFHPAFVVLLNLRNILVVALLLWLLVDRLPHRRKLSG